MALKMQRRRELNKFEALPIVAPRVNPLPDMTPRISRTPCDETQKARIIANLRAGKTQWGMLADDPTLPSETTIYLARKSDPQFAADYDAAREEGMSNRLEEALEYIGSVRTDKQLSIAAEKYANVAVKISEKLAPKRFGPMLKHAGHDGEKLTVNVLDFRTNGQVIDAVAVDVPKLSTNIE